LRPLDGKLFVCIFHGPSVFLFPCGLFVPFWYNLIYLT
jgi:hypothetical protein